MTRIEMAKYMMQETIKIHEELNFKIDEITSYANRLVGVVVNFHSLCQQYEDELDAIKEAQDGAA